MEQKRLRKIGGIGCALAALHAGVAQANDGMDDTAARQSSLRTKLEEQTRRIDALKRSILEQEAELEQLRRAVSSETLIRQRGTGPGNEPVANTQPAPVHTASVSAPQEKGAPPPAIAPIFEEPGVLTPRGKYVLEPSLQYGYSSNNRVALVGYTVIPAILVGLVDVREVKRNTVTATLTGRYGVTPRFEVEARIPYVYRSDSTVSREVGAGSSVNRVFEASGRSLGDIELAARYQLNNGGANTPFYIGTLRFKSRTGRDPFEVPTDCIERCVGDTSGTGLQLDLPTGSGFYSLQPGITWLFPSDPAVFFGSFTYVHNFKRRDVSRKVLGGDKEFLGTIKPGDIIGFNFGMGLSLNEKSSFSLGYDHSSVGRTKQNGRTTPGAVRTQLGTLLLGYSYRLNEKQTLNVSVGAGLTRDTPDLTLTLKMPISF